MIEIAKVDYKGYPIKFVEKILGGKKVVVGETPSKVSGKLLQVTGKTKEDVLKKCMANIETEIKLK